MFIRYRRILKPRKVPCPNPVQKPLYPGINSHWLLLVVTGCCWLLGLVARIYGKPLTTTQEFSSPTAEPFTDWCCSPCAYPATLVGGVPNGVWILFDKLKDACTSKHMSFISIDFKKSI